MCFPCFVHIHDIKFMPLEKGSGVVSNTLLSNLQMQTAGRGNNKTFNNNSGYGIQMELLKYIKNMEKNLKS